MSTTPRSRSRSKRSTTNLSNLRLAPLSTKYEVSKGDLPVKSPLRTSYDPDEDVAFTRSHPSYIAGKSAPTTPGILSRNSSRRNLGGGLSRKGSVSTYGDEEEGDGNEADGEGYGYAYMAHIRRHGVGADERAEFGSGQIPKAKSEITITSQQRAEFAAKRLSGQGVPLASRNRYAGRKSGAATPRQTEPESWLTHTSASAAALVREDKGQSWLTTRQSSTNLAPDDDEDDDDDDHYEEMAALTAVSKDLHLPQYDGGSPVSTRVSRWGSRYGSRKTSRMGSRIASPVGTRTPRRITDQTGYFDTSFLTPAEEPERDFVKPHERRGEEMQDEAEIAKLSGENSYGLGTVVDKIMNFSIFTTDHDHVDTTTDDEGGIGRRENESAEEARRRMELEAKRRREEKETLTKKQLHGKKGDGQEAEAVTGWQDASWLLSVASKVIMN